MKGLRSGGRALHVGGGGCIHLHVPRTGTELGTRHAGEFL